MAVCLLAARCITRCSGCLAFYHLLFSSWLTPRRFLAPSFHHNPWRTWSKKKKNEGLNFCGPIKILSRNPKSESQLGFNNLSPKAIRGICIAKALTKSFGSAFAFYHCMQCFLSAWQIVFFEARFVLIKVYYCCCRKLGRLMMILARNYGKKSSNVADSNLTSVSTLVERACLRNDLF